jgi:hypothetical protein
MLQLLLCLPAALGLSGFVLFPADAERWSIKEDQAAFF